MPTKIARNISLERITWAAEVLKAIGHPVRLQVLEVLEAEEPLSVSEIQGRLRTPVEQSLLSHHLIKMRDKGVLSSEKSGMNMLYRMNDRSILKILDCMENYDR